MGRPLGLFTSTQQTWRRQGSSPGPGRALGAGMGARGARSSRKSGFLYESFFLNVGSKFKFHRSHSAGRQKVPLDRTPMYSSILDEGLKTRITLPCHPGTPGPPGQLFSEAVLGHLLPATPHTSRRTCRGCGQQLLWETPVQSSHWSILSFPCCWKRRRGRGTF